MPRRRNNTSDSSTPATPTALDPVAAPLPRAPVTPAREPRLELARPGRRADGPSETAVTKRLEKLPVEPTPAPLPPSPAAADAERWFEQIPTNPGAPRREPSSIRDVTRTPSRGVPTALARDVPSRSNLMTVLIVATALAVGMVVGALLFSHRGATRCAPCDKVPAAPPPTAAP